MKTLLLSMLSIVFVCGCTKRSVDGHSQITVSQSLEAREVFNGVIGFHEAQRRWPKSSAEVQAGLRYSKIEPIFLPLLKHFTFVEKAGALDVTFTLQDGSEVSVHIDARERRWLNQALGPTRTHGMNCSAASSYFKRSSLA